MRKIIAILLALLAIALTGCSDSAPDPPAESEESIHVAEVSPDGVLELSPCDGVFIQAPFPEIHAVQPYTSTFREFSIEEIQEVFCEKDSVVRTETAFNEITHFYELDSGETVYIMPGMFSYDNMESETQKNLIGLSPSCLVDLEDEASKAWYENHLSTIASTLELPEICIDSVQEASAERLAEEQTNRMENDPSYRKHVEKGEFPYIDQWSDDDARVVVEFSFCIDEIPILDTPFEMLDTTFVHELSGRAYYKEKELVSLDIGSGIPSQILPTASQPVTPSLDDAIHAIRKKYSEIIFQNEITFHSLELLYMPIPNARNALEITYMPVWKCQATQKSENGDWDLEITVYIHAITGEEIR